MVRRGINFGSICTMILYVGDIMGRDTGCHVGYIVHDIHHGVHNRDGVLRGV